MPSKTAKTAAKKTAKKTAKTTKLKGADISVEEQGNGFYFVCIKGDQHEVHHRNYDKDGADALVEELQRIALEDSGPTVDPSDEDDEDTDDE